MSQPLISFIVPVYNSEKYLTECVETILNQHIDKEIILIDDGSTDNSLAQVIAYAKKYPFITAVYQQNKGQSSARNKGLQLARGEYIYFVDSDDYLLGDHFSEICAYAQQYQTDLVRLQAQRQWEIPNQLTRPERIPSAFAELEAGKGYLMSGEQCLKSMTERVWIPGICWTLIKREFLIRHQLAFYENSRAEDQLFYVQLLTCQPDVRILEGDWLVYHYRLRPNSTMTSKANGKFFEDHFTIANQIMLWQQNHSFSPIIQQSLGNILGRLYESAYHYFLQFDEDLKNHYHAYFTPEIVDLINRLYQQPG